MCLGTSMVTRKAARIRAHNATVREVKRAYKASPAAERVHRFLRAHDAMLQSLLEREGVRVY